MLRRLLRGVLVTIMITGALTQGARAEAVSVVTTVAPVTDIVSKIANGRATVTGVIPGGVNSHTFEPAPSDAKTLATADVIIVNGLGLELPLIKLAEAVKGTDVPIVKLGDHAISRAEWKFDFSFPESEGLPNPHLWPNAKLALRYAELAADALVKADPAGAGTYSANLQRYAEALTRLDQVLFNCVATIPEQNRKLVTYHDSFAYFAPRYGMTVIGAIQPADFAEPSAKEVARMITQLRETGVPAIFGSEVFPSPVLEQIAKETGARFVASLSDDTLPDNPGDAEHSYIGMMRQNAAVMAEVLGGDPSCVDSLKD